MATQTGAEKIEKCVNGRYSIGRPRRKNVPGKGEQAEKNLPQNRDCKNQTIVKMMGNRKKRFPITFHLLYDAPLSAKTFCLQYEIVTVGNFTRRCPGW